MALFANSCAQSPDANEQLLTHKAEATAEATGLRLRLGRTQTPQLKLRRQIRQQLTLRPSMKLVFAARRSTKGGQLAPATVRQPSPRYK